MKKDPRALGFYVFVFFLGGGEGLGFSAYGLS